MGSRKYVPPSQNTGPPPRPGFEQPTRAAENREYGTGVVPNNELANYSTYQRGSAGQGGEVHFREWAKRGIGGEQTTNYAGPSSSQALRDTLAGTTRGTKPMDAARAELFASRQPNPEFNRNPDIVGREGRMGRQRNGDLQPYNDGSAHAMAAAVVVTTPRGGVGVANTGQACRQKTDLMAYNEGRPGVDPDLDLPVRPGVRAQDDDTYHGRKKTTVTDDTMRGTDGEAFRLPRADEYFHSLPNHGRASSDELTPRRGAKPGVMGASEAMPQHGRKVNADLSGDFARKANVMGESDEMPYHGRKKTSATDTAMSGTSRSLEKCPYNQHNHGEQLRPDQEAERTRQAIVRKNQGTGVFGS